MSSCGVLSNLDRKNGSCLMIQGTKGSTLQNEVKVLGHGGSSRPSQSAAYYRSNSYSWGLRGSIIVPRVLRNKMLKCYNNISVPK